MQDKVLYVDYEKCTGCRECEVACSLYNAGVSTPARSRIKVLNWEWDSTYLPLSCQNCEDPFCVEVCPAKACRLDPANNRVIIDRNRCIGCKTCIIACPFSAPFLDITGVSVKCEYCDGDPQCVKACPAGAVKYVLASEIGDLRRDDTADRIINTLPPVDIIEETIAEQ